MKRFIKRFHKPLLVLGLFFIIGVQKAYAFWPFVIAATSLLIPQIRNAVAGFFGDVLDDLALDIVDAMARFFGFVIHAISGIMFAIANATISFAIELNNLLADKEYVKESVIGDGYNIMLTVANVGLVISIIVIAFLIMFRINEIRNKRILVRFIFVAVLINFSFYITTSWIIKPVNSITSALHQAANFNIDTFRETFKPSDVNIETVLRIQLASEEEEIAFLEMADKIQALTIKKLKEAEERSINETDGKIDNEEGGNEHSYFYIGGRQGEETVREENLVTDDVRLSVASIITTNVLFEDWLAGMGVNFIDDGSGSGRFGGVINRENLIEKIWEDGIKNPAVSQPYDNYFENYEWGDLDSRGAYYKFADSLIGPADDKSTNSIQGVINNPIVIGQEKNTTEVAAFECNITDPDSTPDKCEKFSKIALVIYKNPNRLATIAVKIGAILFYAAFVIFGSLALFATGVLFIVRYIALGFLIILSPVVWIGYIFQEHMKVGNASMWSVWWKKFMNWVIFGPVSMFFFFLAAKAASALDLNTPTADPDGGTMLAIAGAFGEMIFIIGLLVGGLIVAKKLSLEGANNAYNAATMGSKAVGRLGARIVTGGTGGALRAAGATTRGVGHTISSTNNPLKVLGVGAAVRGVGNVIGATGRGIQKAGGGKPKKIRLAGRIRNARANMQANRQTLRDVGTQRGLSREEIQRILGRIRRGENPNATSRFLQRKHGFNIQTADSVSQQIHGTYKARVDNRQEWADLWQRPGEVASRIARDPKLNPLLATWKGATKGKGGSKKSNKKDKEGDDEP